MRSRWLVLLALTTACGEGRRAVALRDSLLADSLRTDSVRRDSSEREIAGRCWQMQDLAANAAERFELAGWRIGEKDQMRLAPAPCVFYLAKYPRRSVGDTLRQ